MTIQTLQAIRSAGLVAAIVAGALVTTPAAFAQNTVKFTGADTRSCTYNGTIAVDPAGAMTFNVTACTGSTPTTPPTCTIAGPQAPAPNTQFQLTATCTPGPITGYNWNILPTGASSNGATMTASLPVGTYTFNVSAANAAGAGANSADYVVNVAAPTTPPTCTASNNGPITAGASATATVTANCSGATSFAWTAVSGAPAPATPTTASTSVGPFPTAGTFTYSIIASNSNGPSTAVTTTVTVNAASSSGGCPAVSGLKEITDDLGNMRFDLKPGEIGFKKITWPYLDKPYIRISMSRATAAESPMGLTANVAISPCPGTFDTAPAGWGVPPAPALGCERFFSSNNNFYVGTGVSYSTCPVPAGTVYLNVKNVNGTDTNTCIPSGVNGINYCTWWVKGT